MEEEKDVEAGEISFKGRMNRETSKYVPPKILSKEERDEIDAGTIGRFEEYINSFKELEEKKMNEQTKIQEEIVDLKKEDVLKNPFDDIGGTYLKLEPGKAKMLLLKNWKIEKIKKFTDDKGNLKEQMEFSADVLSEDGVACNKVFATTSWNALQGLKTIFSPYFPNVERPVLIRIKKIGEGKSTVYDIEEQRTTLK